MIYLKIIILISISELTGDTFITPIGQCTIEIYNGKIKEIPEIVSLIKSETKQLVKEFGTVKERPFNIYITNSVEDFLLKSQGPVPEWGIAIAKSNPDIIILKSPGLAKISFYRFKEVIIHEINHIYLYRIPKNQTMPSWFKEGMAMRSANEFSLLRKIEISKSRLENKIISLSKLNNFSKVPKEKINLAYSESAVALEALEYYYQKSIIFNLLNQMRNNLNFKQSFEISTGDKYNNFEIKFEEYIRENYFWLFLFRSPNYIYVILPIILIVGFIYRYYKNKKILKIWELEELNERKCIDKLPN